MSDVKDIQKTNSLSVFLDAHSIRTSPFSKNTSGERAYARAERIVAALFLLTNHFNQSEQLRTSLRKNGMGLLSSILSLRAGIRSSGADLVESALALIRELISLVRMSTIAGYISTQNAGEVIQALDDLGLLLVASQRSNLSETVILTRDDLTPRAAEFEVSSARARPHVERKPSTFPTPQGMTPGGSEKSTRILRQEHGTLKVLGKGQNSETGKDGEKNIKSENTDTQRTNADVPSTPRYSNSRSQEVLEILRVSGKLGIKDIYSNMPGCSEKMIQRELARMVSQGQVKKVGAKRWSTYELVR